MSDTRAPLTSQTMAPLAPEPPSTHNGNPNRAAWRDGWEDGYRAALAQPATPATLRKFLDSQDFYEVMQAYRHAQDGAGAASAAFEAVKDAVCEAAASPAIPDAVAFSDLFMTQFDPIVGPAASTLVRDGARLAAACAWNLACPAAAAPAAPDWRRLAHQFDGQRMAAMAHLRMMLADPSGHAQAARDFLAASPYSAATNASLTVAACTVWSVARGYAIRRYFNRKE